MLPRDSYRLSMVVASQLLSSYSCREKLESCSKNHEPDFVFESDDKNVYLSSKPVCVDVNDFSGLDDSLKLFGAFAKDRSPFRARGKWILPVVWKDQLSHAGFLKGEASAVGFLVLMPVKKAQWIGEVTLEIEQQLKGLLTKHQFTLAEEEACLKLNNYIDLSPLCESSQRFQDFLKHAKAGLLPSAELLPAALSLADFEEEHREEYHLGAARHSIMEAVNGNKELPANLQAFLMSEDKFFKIRNPDRLPTGFDLPEDQEKSSPGSVVDQCVGGASLRKSMPDGIKERLKDLQKKHLGLDQFWKYTFSYVLWSLVNDGIEDPMLKERLGDEGYLEELKKTRMEQSASVFAPSPVKSMPSSEPRVKGTFARPRRKASPVNLNSSFNNVAIGNGIASDAFLDKYTPKFTPLITVHGEFATIAAFVSRVIIEMLGKSVDVKKLAEDVVGAVSRVEKMRLQFYVVYKQLLGLVAHHKNNESELKNIVDYLSILFQKPFNKSVVSFDVVIEYLNKLFFDWSAELEKYFAGKGRDKILSFFRQISDPASVLNMTMTCVAEFLNKLPEDLKSKQEDCSEFVGGVSPQQQYEAYLQQEGQQLDVNSATASSLESLTQAEDDRPRTASVGASQSKIYSSSSGVESSDSRSEDLAVVVSSIDVVSPGVIESGKSTSSSVLQAIAEKSLAVTNVINMSPPQPLVVTLDVPKQAEVSNASVVAAPPKPAGFLGAVGRVALGSFGLGLLAVGVLAVIAVTHGAALAPIAHAMPWLITGVINPMIGFMGANAAVAVTSLAAFGIGVVGVTQAAKPGFFTRAWNALRGKSEETVLAVASDKSQSKDVSASGGSTAAMLASSESSAHSAETPGGNVFYGEIVASPELGQDSIDKTPGCFNAFKGIFSCKR